MDSISGKNENRRNYDFLFHSVLPPINTWLNCLYLQESNKIIPPFGIRVNDIRTITFRPPNINRLPRLNNFT